MPVRTEITCRDGEVTADMQRAVLARSGTLRSFGELIQICHVIIIRRDLAAEGGRQRWSVRLNLVLRSGRTVRADLIDRHRWFASLEESLDAAFGELRSWLVEAAPHWRAAIHEMSSSDDRAGPALHQTKQEVDEVDEVRLPAPLVLQGTHHYVG